MKNYRHVLKIITAIISVIIIGYFLEFPTHGNEILEHNLEVIIELFTVFVSFSIFVITWYSYTKSKDNHALFIGVAFILIGSIDLFHVLSYHFMPDFITHNTPHKSAFFWILARIVSSMSFLLSAYIYRNTLPVYINKRMLSASASVSLLVVSVTGIYYHKYIPEEILGQEFSYFRIVYLLITAAIILYASYRYTKRLDEHKTEVFLIYGFVLLYFSDLIYFSYEISAHLLKALGFYYVFVSMYKSSVELPYQRLSVVEEKLRHSAETKYRNMFDNANDAIITTDTCNNITSWNHSAEIMFGWQAEEVMGKKLRDLIVPKRLFEERDNLFGRVVSGEKALIGVETVRQRKDGTELDVGYTVSTLLDIDKESIGFSIIIRDITESKKYENSLKKSKEFMETVLDSMNDEVSIIDVNNFKIVDVNRVFLKNYGLMRDEVIGKTCHKITHARDSPCIPPDDLCPLTETVEMGKHSVFEHVHYTKGEKHYVEVSTSPIFDDNGKIIQVVHVARDITERKLAEMALIESEGKFRSMAQTAMDAIIIADENGDIVSWNKGAEKIFNYTEEETAGKPLTLLMPERYREAHKKGLERILKGEMSRYIGRAIELHGLRKDGSEFPIEFSVASWKTEKGMFFGGIIHDITERKLATEKLTESRDFYLTLFEGFPAMIWRSGTDAKCNYFNKAWLEYTGRTLEQEIGDGWVEGVHPDDVDMCVKIYMSAFEEHKSFEMEYRLRNNDGGYGIILDIGRPFYDMDGNFAGYIGSCYDITKRKQAEELRLENIRLTLADKAKSDFLSIMSHELRTPLNATLGFSELLKQGKAGKLNEKQEHFVDNILKGGRHLLELIEDILDLSKIEAGKIELQIEKVSIPVVIDETLSIIKVLAEKRNVVIKKEIDPGLDFIDSEYKKFRQILYNLVNNAVKFSKESGGIVTVTAKKEGRMLRMSVSDTGIGIKGEDLDRLFKEFEQLDSGITRKYGGTGLGLTISKKLVELHGGTIYVESEYGVGSTFTITLPIVAEKPN